MKKILFLIFSFSFLIPGLHAQSKDTVELIKKQSDKNIVIVTIKEKGTKKILPMTDVWIGKKRIPANSNGQIVFKGKVGKNKLTARAFSFKNMDYSFHLNKNESAELTFYLEPVVFEAKN